MERRVNYVGRLVVSLHTKYCVPSIIPVLWVLVVVLGVLQVMSVAWSS